MAVEQALAQIEADAVLYHSFVHGPAGSVATEGGSLANMAMQAYRSDQKVLQLSIFNPRGAWVTGAVYAFRDIVTQSGVNYMVLTGHTAGTFATDLAAGRLAIHQDPTAAILQAALAGGTEGEGVDLVAGAGKVLFEVDDLSVTSPLVHPHVRVRCFETLFDDGHGEFDWDDASEATPVRGLIHQFGTVATGRWVRVINGFITPEMVGGDIVNAAEFCTANGIPIFGVGTYTITETLELFCFGDLSQATVNANAALVNPAVRVHATSLAKPIDIKLPMVNNNAHIAADGWAAYASAVGVSIDNLYNSTVYIPQVKGFGVGADIGGTTSGCSYNSIKIGELRNNKVNLKVGPKSAVGWSNENTYQMGRCRHDTSEANGLVPFAGTRHILVTANGYATVPNNNLFIKPCVEGDTTTVSATEFMVDLVDAQTNTFIQTRWETPHPNGPTLRFEATSADMCTGNVFLNNGVYQPNITKVGGVTANTVMGSGRVSQSFDSGGDGVGFSNGYTDGVGGPHIQGFKATTTALGKRRTATDWVYRLHATGLNGKQSTDAEARMRISWSTPGIYMGSGTINPVSGFQPYGNYQIDVTDSTRLKIQGSWNGGYLMMGVYALWVDGSGKLRIKSGAPASDTDGSIVGP